MVSGRYSSLDGMRGVAALAVVLFHWQEAKGQDLFPGYLAVDLFFILSGFVLARSYEDRFVKGLGFDRFIKQRAVRLLPLYYLGVGLGIGRQIVGVLFDHPKAMGTGSLILAIIFAAVMLPAPVRNELFPLNGPSWSLFFEVVINIALAIWLWRAKTWQIVIFVAAGAAILLVRVRYPQLLNAGWGWDTFDVGVARTVFSFGLGILIHRLSSSGARPRSLVSPLVITLMLVLLIYHPSVSVQKIYELICVFVWFPIIVAVGIHYEPPEVLRKLFTWLGDISYAAYAIHWPLITAFEPILEGVSLVLSSVIFGAGILCAAHLAARADGRFRSWINARLEIRQSAPLKS